MFNNISSGCSKWICFHYMSLGGRYVCVYTLESWIRASALLESHVWKEQPVLDIQEVACRWFFRVVYSAHNSSLKITPLSANKSRYQWFCLFYRNTNLLANMLQNWGRHKMRKSGSFSRMNEEVQRFRTRSHAHSRAIKWRFTGFCSWAPPFLSLVLQHSILFHYTGQYSFNKIYFWLAKLDLCGFLLHAIKSHYKDPQLTLEGEGNCYVCI